MDINISPTDAIKKLKKDNNTEGYLLSKEGDYLGKINILDLLITKNKNIQNCMVKKPLIIEPQSNLLEVIKSLSDFVGESIPIVNKKSNKMIGIISENDVLLAYLEISEEINQIEKH
jgi:CIC family chloride channel protein